MHADPLFIVPDMIRIHAEEQPNKTALIQGDIQLNYAEFDKQIDAIAAALQHAGIEPEDTIALCGVNSISYAVLFIGALRAGVVSALIAPSSTTDGITAMTRDSGAKILFIDKALASDSPELLNIGIPTFSLDTEGTKHFISDAPSTPEPVAINPKWAFNIIYSSGTTGAPKGIVQSHGMRSGHVGRAGAGFGYSADAVTMIATPLYSNTTLVSFVPAIALGGTIVLMGKFDAATYLGLAEKHRATHAMLVPVQYKRIMDVANFDTYDLSSFQVKFCTSAPFSGALKADILARWPGGLVEFYGMTEGGGTCILVAHQHRDKLETVGVPAEGHDIRLIDDDGIEVESGKMGEIVGASEVMMDGYKGLPEKTREAEWYDTTGKRFIRTGDIGRFDRDGFLTLMDRKKDMIISGGFNIYPSDLEAELLKHSAVSDAAVVGVPSEDWGETPVAYIVLKAGANKDSGAIKSWLAERVGKTQRLHDIVFTPDLPRSAIGKILKRELRDSYAAE